MVTVEQINELRTAVKTNYERYMAALDAVAELAQAHGSAKGESSAAPCTTRELALQAGIRMPLRLPRVKGRQRYKKPSSSDRPLWQMARDVLPSGSSASMRKFTMPALRALLEVKYPELQRKFRTNCPNIVFKLVKEKVVRMLDEKRGRAIVYEVITGGSSASTDDGSMLRAARRIRVRELPRREEPSNTEPALPALTDVSAQSQAILEEIHRTDPQLNGSAADE